MRSITKPLFTSEFLSEEYIKKEKSTYQIADENNVSYQYIRRYLIHYGIPLRNKSEAQRAALKTGSAISPKAAKKLKSTNTNEIEEKNNGTPQEEY